MTDLITIGKWGKKASNDLKGLTEEKINKVLCSVADEIVKNKDYLIKQV